MISIGHCRDSRTGVDKYIYTMVSSCKNTESRKLNSRYMVTANRKLNHRRTIVAALLSFLSRQLKYRLYCRIFRTLSDIYCSLAIDTSIGVALGTNSMTLDLIVADRGNKLSIYLVIAVYSNSSTPFNSSFFVCCNFFWSHIRCDKCQVERHYAVTRRKQRFVLDGRYEEGFQAVNIVYVFA